MKKVFKFFLMIVVILSVGFALFLSVGLFIPIERSYEGILLKIAASNNTDYVSYSLCDIEYDDDVIRFHEFGDNRSGFIRLIDETGYMYHYGTGDRVVVHTTISKSLSHHVIGIINDCAEHAVNHVGAIIARICHPYTWGSYTCTYCKNKHSQPDSDVIVDNIEVLGHVDDDTMYTLKTFLYTRNYQDIGKRVIYE